MKLQLRQLKRALVKKSSKDNLISQFVAEYKDAKQCYLKAKGKDGRTNLSGTDAEKIVTEAFNKFLDSMHG